VQEESKFYEFCVGLLGQIHNKCSIPTCSKMFISSPPHDVTTPSGSGPPQRPGGTTPLYEWSARRRGLYVTTYNTHKRQTPVSRRNSNPQTHALDSAAISISQELCCLLSSSTILILRQNLQIM